MTLVVAPVQEDVYTAVKAMILDVLSFDNAHVVKGVQNRNAMPEGPFVEMYIALGKRLRTNLDTWDVDDPDPAGITREQGMQLELQLSIYGPTSGDQAALFTTLWRDDFACLALAPTCQPLHADDPTRAPLITGEEQYLDKWLVRAQLQYNPTVSTSDEFADIVAIGVISVTERYPP